MAPAEVVHRLPCERELVIVKHDIATCAQLWVQGLQRLHLELGAKPGHRKEWHLPLTKAPKLTCPGVANLAQRAMTAQLYRQDAVLALDPTLQGQWEKLLGGRRALRAFAGARGAPSCIF